MTYRTTNYRCRREKGSLLTMTALLFGIVLLFCVVGFAFYTLLAQQKKGQATVDETTLNVVRLLNDGDHIGQMNNIVERCRELVYISRANDDKAQWPRNQLYRILSKQLLEESRENAKLVEEERKNQIKLCVKNVQTAIFLHNQKAPTGTRLALPWFGASFPEMYEVKLGYINGVQCNVENLQVIPDLREFDLDKKYIQKGSNLYLGNINAKLPEPDDDLDFKLSSLAAPVVGTVASTRLTAPEVWQPTATVYADQKIRMAIPDQLPGALQIVEMMKVSSGQNEGTVRLSSTATANGAMPSP